MGRSKETFGKKNVKDNKAKKRKEKEKRKLEKKATGKSSLDDMIAYVDENGNIVDTPPDLTQKAKINLDDIDISTPKKVEEEVAERTGFIDFFNNEKNFGFIKEKGTNEKFFVHANNLIDKIKEGNKVNFEIRKGIKGMEAFNVKLSNG